MNIHIKASIFLVSLVFLVNLLPVQVEARTVVRSGDSVSIGQDQLIEGDFYTTANIINISGEVSEDLIAVGTEVNLNGTVGVDALIAGGNVDVHGAIGDDLRILGGNVIIAEPVLGDVFIIGATVKVLSSASITGDITVIGGDFEIEAPVEGRILGWVESLRIDSAVSGDVEITTSNLTLGDRANINGSIQYISVNQLVRSQSAVVGGEIVRNDPVVETAQQSIATLILPLLALLFSVALWYLLSRRMLQRVTNRALQPIIRPALVGGLVLLLTPFAISILLVSMLGFLAGVVLLATYVLFFTLSIVALPATLGQFSLALFRKEVPSISLLSLLLGTAVVGLCLVVPVIGPIVLLGFFVLTFGAIVDLLIRSNR